MREMWSRFRDRLLSDPRFHRWALRLPFTRAIARKRAAALFDLVSGFVYSQVLLACVQLGLLEFLKDGPRSVPDVAGQCGLTDEVAERLLRAAVPLGLLEERSPGCFGLGYLGAPLLADPGLLALIRHNALFYRDLNDPVALLKGTRSATELTQYWAYASTEQPGGLPAPSVDDYSELMAETQSLIAANVARAYDFSSHRSLLDVGGGEGEFCSVVAQAYPALKVTAADLPAVAERARIRFESVGLTERASGWGGDFLADTLPQGADVATLVRVVHDHDDDAVLKLLANIHQALAPGGTLLVAEQMSGTAGAETVGDTYFGLYLLAMGSGRPRSAEQLGALLEQSGFSPPAEIAMPLPLQARLLRSRKLA